MKTCRHAVSRTRQEGRGQLIRFFGVSLCRGPLDKVMFHVGMQLSRKSQVNGYEKPEIHRSNKISKIRAMVEESFTDKNRIDIVDSDVR